jgi:hypothetical protein
MTHLWLATLVGAQPITSKRRSRVPLRLRRVRDRAMHRHG